MEKSKPNKPKPTSKSVPSFRRLSPEEQREAAREAKRALDFQRLRSDKTAEREVQAGLRKPN